MNRRDFLKTVAAGALLSSKKLQIDFNTVKPPNILWIVSEDNSPFLGCYGDTFATTPNLDALAAESVVFDHAFANAPVCAPTRFTIVTGMYACTMGTHNMRSRYDIPDFVKPYPHYLRGAGYYCTNPGKTDYNFKTTDKSHWDSGTYKDRPAGQPFFHVFNTGISHESSIHKRQDPIRHDYLTVPLPPYHPDTVEIRKDWAQYYDKIEDMDTKVGEVVAELEAEGLAEDTIVFYYSDHGGVLCRSKRFVYETGTHVPMMIRFPKKYQHLAPSGPGTRTDRIVCFVDLAPTILSLAGIRIPEYMQGEAFLGDQQKAPREYAYLFRNRMDEVTDMMRAVRDKKFRYIRNYMPHRIYGQHLNYLWKAANTQSWEQEYLAGRCDAIQSIFWETKPPEELYDVEADPWEVNNLASDPQYANTLSRMRAETSRWVHKNKDAGFLPEQEMVDRSAGTTIYDLIRQPDFPIERIIDTAEMASMRDANNLAELINRLGDGENVVRYWAAIGCSVLGPAAQPAKVTLLTMQSDPSADVQSAVEEALLAIG
jgi:arylsulfatase A-like enzyme